MSYRCLDLETTGLPKDDRPSGIMQIGWCDMRFNIIKPPQGMFVDCGIPVEIEARAIHHISDEMCAGEIKPDEAARILSTGEHEYTAAHNIEHEKHYIGTGFKPLTEDVRPWICTFKTSLRIWPDAPGHKLQELRYFLKLDDEEDFDPKLAEPPHRAPGDAYVCTHLLRRVLKEITVEQAVRWSSGPALLYMCFMKKHKGTPWKDVPPDYLRWILEKSDVTDRDIRATAKYYLTRSAKPDASGNP